MLATCTEVVNLLHYHTSIEQFNAGVQNKITVCMLTLSTFYVLCFSGVIFLTFAIVGIRIAVTFGNSFLPATEQDCRIKLYHQR